MSFRENLVMLCILILFHIYKVHGEDGHCSWYGECGPSPTGKYNCKYTGPAIPMTNQTGLKILKTYCPDLIDGNEPLTCCDTDQLITLERNMRLPQQFLEHCPSCYYNFLNLFCYQTCYKSMSNFVRIDSVEPYGKNKSSVRSIDFFVTHRFANGMFNSCDQVKMPSVNERALTIFCGHPAKECTIQKWLDFMGDPSNGHTPFKTNYTITDNSWVDPNTNITYNPMDANITSCNETSHNQSACSCLDCAPWTCPLPRPTTILCYDSPSTKTKSFYKVKKLVITRPNNHTKISHELPGPTQRYVNYTALFDKTFLHMLLNLQLEIESLKATYKNKAVSLHDVCLTTIDTNNNSCITQSIFDYWQKNHTNIDKIVMDPSGFFVKDNYLDHFLYCTWVPDSANDPSISMSCLGTNSPPVYPWVILNDYDEENYMNATTFNIIIVLKNNSNKTLAWEQKLRDFIKEKQKNTKNMTIALIEEEKAIGVPFCQDLSAEDNFTCCLSIDKHINCNQSCSHNIMYLPTSNLNCSGNGETPDNTNIEISLIYNSTCPPGFKEISVNESVPVCLQCNDTSPANDTTTKSYTTTGYETTTTTKGHSSTAPTSNNDSKSYNMALAAVILSVISIIGVGTIIILYLVRRKLTKSTPYRQLTNQSEDK